MRILTKPSTAKCTLEGYVAYLLSDPLNTSCSRLSSIMQNVSHDSVNRFLVREDYTPEYLYLRVSTNIDRIGGVLSIDDSVLDKPYSDADKTPLIGYFWSGKHHRVVKGTNLVTLFYTDKNNVRVPVNYRIYRKTDNQSKNDYFLEMLDEVLSWGLLPTWITGDSWYSSLKNLKHVRKSGLNFLFGIESNRLVSIEKGEYLQVQAIPEWPKDGVVVYLKEYGKVRVFKQTQKNVSRYYAIGMSNLEELGSTGGGDFERIHAAHWHIECFHRTIKQVCNIEHFQVRNSNAINTHVFCSLLAFVELELLTLTKKISHWYQLRREMFVAVIRGFVERNTSLLIKQPHIPSPVNA